ncbi:MAG: DUF2088 domain-containing protein [Deltaproteobacteria bacterium]|nr:DUF2088 domain-containing protein [Deltaproteobacteria bacterium]MDQ3295027.1 lactate racemase domain-containing protein [Myxococcota bacterium]
MVELPYGSVPYPVHLGSRTASILELPRPPAPPPLAGLLDVALAHPLGRPSLDRLVAPGTRITVVVSDATRDEPRSGFLAALRRALPLARWTIAIATGTHGPSALEPLGIDDELRRAARVVNHDGHDESELVTLGTTTRGTPVRVHRCIVDTDLVIATGCIRPHYFAGFGAGAKAVFPGLGQAHAIRVNHRWKTDPRAIAGSVDDNPCRLDLEEAVAMLPAPVFLLNGVCGNDGAVHAAIAGDPVVAFREGARLARDWFVVRAPRAPLVIASDALPITASLYQAAKIASAVAPLVEPGGTLLLVAECAEGVEPLETVNEAIFRIGVLPRLADGVSIQLVSSLSTSVVERTLVHSAASIGDVLARVPGVILIVPHASHLIVEVTS